MKEVREIAKTVIQVDPISRVSGFLSIEVIIEDGKIIDAKSGGMQFRGFEKMLQGRYPLDAIRLTGRVCGICSCAHTVASSKALEMALKIEPDLNGVFIRNFAHGFEFLQNHIRQIYQFAIPDYVDVSEITPLLKPEVIKDADYRLPKEVNDIIAGHYKESIEMSRLAHKGEATVIGKAPHNHGIFVGGVTANFDILMYQTCKSILTQIKEFLETRAVPDLLTILKYYPEYEQWGTGFGNYMSYGCFEELPETFRLHNPGIIIQGKKQELDLSNITTSIRYAWLEAEKELRFIEGEPPTIAYGKPGAYSWVEAPRYGGFSMEVGPMANRIVNGLHEGNKGALNRVLARLEETIEIAEKMQQILEEIQLKPAYQERWEIPKEAEGYAAIGAPRGGLMHVVKIQDKVIQHYNLLPPSNWNLSPRDGAGTLGAVEASLVGTPIKEITQAKTVIGRIVRSFDPCLNCAAHIISDRKEPFDIQVV